MYKRQVLSLQADSLFEACDAGRCVGAQELIHIPPEISRRAGGQVLLDGHDRGRREAKFGVGEPIDVSEQLPVVSVRG